MRFVALFAVFALSAPAMAQNNAVTPAATATAAEKKVCRAVSQTGSILGGKRECHTKKEWVEIAERNRVNRENRSGGDMRDNGNIPARRD